MRLGSDKFKRVVVCPRCRGELAVDRDVLTCAACPARYPIVDGVACLVLPSDAPSQQAKEFAYWNAKEATPEQLYENLAEPSFQALIDAMALPSDSVGLELGCGDGPFARRLTGRGMEIYGLDVSVPLLKLAQNMTPVQGDATRLPFRDAAFDWVLFAFALHHVAAVDAALDEVCRVVKPHGRVAVVEPNYHHPVRYLTRDPEQLLRRKVFTRLSPEERWVRPRHVQERLARASFACRTTFVTPRFTSESTFGKVQRVVSSTLGAGPLARFVHSYYLVTAAR